MLYLSSVVPQGGTKDGCALLYAVGYGTQNSLKIVINFYFWYIGCNLGGDNEEII
jgi:hypothetical protein